MRKAPGLIGGVGAAILLAACGGPKNSGLPDSRMSSISPLDYRAETAFEGRIVFQSDLDGDNEIYLLSAAGLKKLTDNNFDDRYPRWSPDGRRIAYSANHGGNFDIFVMDADGGQPRQITHSRANDLDVSWGADGKTLCFTRTSGPIAKGESAIWKIDLASGLESRAVPGFRRSNGLEDVSPVTGEIAFTGKRMLGGWDIFLCDPPGASVRELTRGGRACRPRFSRDGRRIAFVSSETDGKGDIWAMNADGGGRERITDREEAYDYFPSWSPDGTRIVFCSNARSKYADKGDWGLYIVDVRDHRVVPLLDTPGRDVFPDWR